MTQTVWRSLGGVVVLVLASAFGCGESSSSSGASSAGAASTSSGRYVIWDDNGVAETGLIALAVRASSGTTDSLEVIASNTRDGVTLAVTAPRPLGPQTFTCNQTSSGQSVSVTSSGPDGGSWLGTQSCSVVLTEIGMAGGGRAVGTFSAVIASSDGGSKVIANGSFDVPITK